MVDVDSTVTSLERIADGVGVGLVREDVKLGRVAGEVDDEGGAEDVTRAAFEVGL